MCRLSLTGAPAACGVRTPNLPTKIVDFRGFDSSVILNFRGGMLMSIGNFPESLIQAMLVGIMLVGRLDVRPFSYFGFAVSANLRDSPQSFHKSCAEK